MLKLLYQLFKDEKGTTLAVTYSFSPNTLIVSSYMNTNFNDVIAVVNALTADNLADDAVTAAKLNSDVVRSGYGLIQHTDGSLYVDVSDTTPCLEISDGGLRVKVDGTTIQRTSSGLAVVTGAVTDHGGLTGLTDDDHSIYLNTTRHDADDHSSFNFATMGTGVLPASKGGIGTPYDSGWFAVSANAAYSKTHGLGTTKVLCMVYFSTSASGADNVYGTLTAPGYWNGVDKGCYVKDLTTTTVKVQTGDSVGWTVTDGGSVTELTSGYARIIILALE